jgi:hypothetical protein
MKSPPKSLAWSWTWQAFTVYACAFLGASLLPIWPPLQGVLLVLGGTSAYLVGVVRMLDWTRPFWGPVQDQTRRCPGSSTYRDT